MAAAVFLSLEKFTFYVQLFSFTLVRCSIRYREEREIEIRGGHHICDGGLVQVHSGFLVRDLQWVWVHFTQIRSLVQYIVNSVRYNSKCHIPFIIISWSVKNGDRVTGLFSFHIFLIVARHIQQFSSTWNKHSFSYTALAAALRCNYNEQNNNNNSNLDDYSIQRGVYLGLQLNRKAEEGGKIITI